MSVDVADRSRTRAGRSERPGEGVASLTERLQAAQHALVRAEAAAGVRTAPVPARGGIRPSPSSRPDSSGVVVRGDERFLPVPEALGSIVPFAGVRRGSVVQVAGSVTLLLDVVAAACREGAWCAVVGMPDLGLAAAAEIGLPLDRLAFVPCPGADAPAVLSAAVDGFDVVVVGEVNHLVDRDRRQLSSRVRHREAVLFTSGPWPGAELVLSVTGSRWAGPGRGEGALREREISVLVGGRGALAGRRVRGRLCSTDGVRLLPESGAAGRAIPDAGGAGPDVIEQRAG
jgi:hypothetical protein